MDWDSSSYFSSDSGSESSESTTPSVLSDNHISTERSTGEQINYEGTDFPFNFASNIDDDQAGSDSDDSVDGGIFDSATASLSSANGTMIQQQISSTLPKFEGDYPLPNIPFQGNVSTREGVTDHSSEAVSSSSAVVEAMSIMHRGSLRRIVNPSTISSSHHSNSRATRENPLTSWPMYSVSVALKNQNLSPFARKEKQHMDQYQIIFNRQQYEFCVRMFALLDTDCQSYIGPECLRNFLYLHCPVVRRRDTAIIRQTNYRDDCLSSPTVNELWNVVISSDPSYNSDEDKSTRIGIEGWMLLCRLLALVHEQESQRRFASRHLQQMMRHKHGSSDVGRSGIINPNEVVVVVDNPPPGPPIPISIEALMQIERERSLTSNCACIQGWPYSPLPLPQLDLDHWLLPTVRDTVMSASCQSRGTISIEPFSSSIEGGFILRFVRNGDSSDKGIVARRSFADFEWLNQILKSHKRPGNGHLCGRILPPFPTTSASFVTSSSGNQVLHSEVGEKAVNVAKSGVGKLASVAKSIWGGYGYIMSGIDATPSSQESLRHSATKSTTTDDAPIEVARALERYLNYLSENEAFITSFPLNAILQGSQTGLESAKMVLHEHVNMYRKEKKLKNDSASADGKLTTASTIYNALLRKRVSSMGIHQEDDDTPWLRAAAKVAVALQFHGILETTGYESTSAKIQHASLPKFNNAKNSWDEEEDTDTVNGTSSSSKQDPSAENMACFETGVVKIESELNDEQDVGYDLLPLPGLSDEQSILNAGTSVLNCGGACTEENSRQFIYRMATDQDVSDKYSTIGTMNLETDIDRIREIIKSVNHTLGKMYKASKALQKSQQERNTLKSSLLRGIDSWCGSNDVISQSALISGVSDISTASSDSDSSCKRLSNGELPMRVVVWMPNDLLNPLIIFFSSPCLDLSWQSSLAVSVSSSTTEVHDALKASVTAVRAKATALIAAEKAKDAYESLDSTASKEEILPSQKNAFAGQSHAIHATVVEYEANVSFKRATMSLVHDMKCWNVHRKKGLLQTCIQFAKSQKEACKKASDAWLSLHDGLIESEYKPLATVGLDSLVNLDFSPTENNSSCWNLSRSDLSSESRKHFTATDVTTSLLSVQSSQSESASSLIGEVATQKVDTYDVASSDLNVDFGYFAYRQDDAHDFCSKASDVSASSEDEASKQPSLPSRSGRVKPDESHIHEADDNRSECSSTSMRSLIDGLMTWGENDDQTENDLLVE